MSKTVVCRYCKKQIEKDNAYSKQKGMYYCNEQCYIQHQHKKNNTTHKVLNETESVEYRKLTDYIQLRFGTQSPTWWSQFTRVTRQLVKNNNMKFSGMLLTLQYYYDILNKHSNENVYGLQQIIVTYYEEAKNYFIETVNKNALGQALPNDKIVTVVAHTRGNKKDKRLIDMNSL